MGIWGSIGKWALPIAGIAAAPFTGGASLLGTLGSVGGKIASGINAATPALGALGSVASGAAKGSADQRLSEGEMALRRYIAESTNANNQNQLASTTARDAAQFGMQGAQFNAGEQQRGMRNALVSQLLGGIQDAKLSGGSGRIPQMSVQGGLRPSALGNREALMSALSQPTMQAPGYQAPTPTAMPAMPGMPDAGVLEKLLGGVGLGGSILGALGSIKKPTAEVPQAGAPTQPETFIDPRAFGGDQWRMMVERRG